MDGIATSWYELLENERTKLKISDLDFSALASWVLDCENSYSQIYGNLLKGIKDVDRSDRDALCNFVWDIHSNLEHIKNHINAAETGFKELMKVLEED